MHSPTFPENLIIMGHLYHNSRTIMGAILYYHLGLCSKLFIMNNKPLPADHISEAAWKEWHDGYY